MNCGAIVSVQSGSWSVPEIWDPQTTPSACTTVTVASGHTVTIDTMTAVSSTATINGTIKVSRVVNSSWTLVGGNINVNSGGTLDYGNEDETIPAEITSHLVLAYGAVAGQYGLIVNNGGNFTVRGSTKTPYSYATADITTAVNSFTVYGSTSIDGWQAGDTIIIGPTSGSGTGTTASRTIAGINTAAAPVYTVNWAGGTLPQARTLANGQIIVSNLTRNVLVRSSGTVTDAAGGNSAYIVSLTPNATNFALSYGEFAYLGANLAVKGGITFNSPGKGSISSSTIRNGYNGVMIDGSSAISLTRNNLYSNAEGIYIRFTSNNTLIGNNAFSNNKGIEVYQASNNTLTGNNTYSNGTLGTAIFYYANNNTVTGNNSYSNTHGIYVGLYSNNNVFTGNNGYSNSSYGVYLVDSSNNNNFSGNNFYSNPYGIYTDQSSGNTVVDGNIGYNAAGVSSKNTTAEIYFVPGTPGTPEALILKGVRVNPAVGISTVGMDVPGASLISYNQDADTGTVRVWGNYQLAGSTLTLDYSTYTYVSANTAGKLMRGTGHTITNIVTNDAYTLSELITVTHSGGNSWTVTGSSSGVLGTFTQAVSGYYDFVNNKVNFRLTVGSTLNVDDTLDFVTMAASNDANIRKKLLFGPAALTFNNGHSKLEVGATGGIVLSGRTDGTANTLIGWLGAGSTYYTFVDSGAFTAVYSSFTNMDQGGIQLSGNSGVAISSSTFDYLGFASGTNTYITARDLTSTATLNNVTFGLSRSSAGYSAYNVWVEGADSGLNWTIAPLAGALWGEKFDNDLNNKVVWPDCRSLTSAQSGSWSVPAIWDLEFVPTLCNAVTVAAGHTVVMDTMTAVSSTAAINGTLEASRVASSSWTLVGGNINVNSGGTLDYGTEDDTIPTAINAQLVLASGTYAGQYGLIVNNGGNFTVRGSTKTPYAFATQSISATSLTVYGSTSAVGWQAGDQITIGPTSGSGAASVSSRTIVSITGLPDCNSPSCTVNFSGAALNRTLSSTTPIIVANLTRNVLVQSSGTDVNSNSAYIQNLARNTTSFALAYGEFAYLGNNAAGKYGILFNGAGVMGSISSCTVRNGFMGIYLSGAVINNTFTGNNIYGNTASGSNSFGSITLNSGAKFNTLAGNNIYGNPGNAMNLTTAPENIITGNYTYANTGDGMLLSADYNTITGNYIYSNGQQGIVLMGARNNTLIDNKFYLNAFAAVDFFSSSNFNILAGNNAYSNMFAADFYQSSNNTFVGNTYYSNSARAVQGGDSSVNNSFVGDTFGYDLAGVSRPEGSYGEVFITAGFADTFILKGSRVNTAYGNNGVYANGLNTAGASVLSYNQNADTGTVRLWGNYTVAGSTLTLDHAQRLYVSTNTAPKLMWGTGHSITNVITDDTATLSELITVKHTGGSSWTVLGSSSGVLGTFTRAASGSYDFTASSKVKFRLTAGSALNAGDMLDFLTIAASNDANIQKKLLFGPMAASYNNGHSKLEVTGTGGVLLRGNSNGTANTLVNILSGSTYYTFVDSGAFTAVYSSFTNMDQSGIQLSGSADMAISSSTFDYLGFAAGTNAYITARSLVSNAVLDNVTFALSRSSAGYSAYNVWVEGTDSGLNWTMTNPAGALWGEKYDSDLNSKIAWVNCGAIVSVQSGGWSIPEIWDPQTTPSACTTVTVAPGHTVTIDTMTAVSSTATINGILKASRVVNSSWTLVGGNINVNSGGTLDYGNEDDTIPTGVNSHLVLAYGATAGQYGLIVNNGGNFTVRGSTKTPYAFATQSLTTSSTSFVLYGSTSTLGWQAGDTIVIGPTSGQGETTAAKRTIASITGTGEGPFNVNWSGGTLPQARVIADGPIIVANLSRNVLVRSSGTLTSANSAYIRDLAQNATSFALTEGEFAYLGNSYSGKYGITFDGVLARGSISSSTVRNGYYGIYFNSSASNVLTGNNVYANNNDGVYLSNAGNNIFSGNNFFANTLSLGYGVNADASNYNVFSGNNFFSNRLGGIQLHNSSNTSFAGNSSYSNGAMGIYVTGSGNMLYGNNFYSNAQYGIYFENSGSNTLTGNNSYSNGSSGIALYNSTNITLIGGSLGYDSAGHSRPNLAEANFSNTNVNSLILKDARINPVIGISTAGISQAGSYLLSYNQDGSAGNLKLWGNYKVAGSTLTLDYASALYVSSNTAPKLMSGTGHSASVVATSDINAVSQLIAIRYDASVPNWRVEGSSSGLLGVFPGSIVNQPFPAVDPQFNLTFTQGGSPKNGDRLDFILTAASKDSNRQKSLLFGPVAPAFNSGRSKLEVASTGGLVLRGRSDGTVYTLIDWLGAGSTYYTFVDSGAFTAAYSSFTNMDQGGIQLSGSAGVAISSSTFDYLGFAAGSNSYITMRDLNTGATFNNVAFWLSRPAAGYDPAYNVLVAGSDAGLAPVFQKTAAPLGPLWGENYDSDPGAKVAWADGILPGAVTDLGAVVQSTGSVLLSWTAQGDDGGLATLNDSTFTIQYTSVTVDAQNPAFWSAAMAQVNISTSAIDPGASLAYGISGLAANTSWYFRLWTRDAGGNYSALSNGATVATLIEPPATVYFDDVSSNSITASGYAAAPAFSNLELGASGVVVARDTAYEPWRGGNKWATKAALPMLRRYMATGVIGGKIYMVGGYNGTDPFDTNVSYDPATNDWETKAVMPTVRYGAAAGVIGGKLYVVGGFNQSSYLNKNEVYDPAANAWSTKAVMPSTRAYLAVGVIGGRLYAMGGFNDPANLDANEMYDPVSDTWSTKAVMFTGRSELIAGVIGGKLYAAAGYNGSYLDTNEEYDPVHDTWLTKTAMPTARVEPAAGVIGGKLYVVGGVRPDVAVDNNEEYDPVSNTWAIKPALPTPRGGLFTGVVGGKLYALGGAYLSYLDTNEEYDPGVAALFSALAPNKLYNFKAKARNLAGVETSESATVSTYTLAAVPGAVAPAFTGVSSISVTVNWTPSANPAGTTYYMQLSSVPGFSPVVFSSSTLGLQLSTSALSPNTTYYARVAAINGDGIYSEYLMAGSTITLAAVPGAAAPAFTGVSSNTLTVNWTPGGNPDGTAYHVEISSDSNFLGKTSSSTITGLNSAFSGLSVNTTYYSRVAALNGNGLYSAYLAGSTITLTVVPGAATPAYTSVSSTALTINWAAGDNPGGTVYYVELSTESGFASRTGSATVTALSVVFGGLSINATHYSRVAAVNGSGSYSDYFVPGSTMTLVETPTGIYFDEITTNSITASAYAPTPAFTGLETGLSGVAVAIDNAYQPLRNGNKWTTKLVMPAARSGPAGAVVGGKIYVVGGHFWGTADNSNQEYDPVANTWLAKAQMSVSRNYLAAAAVDGKVYAIGGRAGDAGADYTANEAFDPVTNMWETKAPMTTARSWLSIAAVQGKIFAIGGINGSTILNTNEEYDPLIDAWAAKTPMLTSRVGGAAAVAGGKVYVIGGNTGSVVNINEEYNPVFDTWATKAPMSVSRANLAACAVGGKIYAIGGVGGAANENEQYDPAVNTWTSKTMMPTARDRMAGAVVGGRIYVIGGDSGAPLTANEEYDPGVASSFTALTPNTQYSFKAKARNAIGAETGESITVSTYTLALPLAAAGVFKVYHTSASLTWTAIGGNNGYSVLASSGAGGVVLATATSNGGANSLTVTGLKSHTVYYFQAGTLNGDGVANYITAGSTLTLPNISARSGPWSAPDTWVSGVPAADAPVIIDAGHTVTLDIMTAVSSTATINGTLKASRVASSSWTLLGGDIYVNPGGTLDYGAEEEIIPDGIVSHLVLAYGATAGQYGLIVKNGGNFTVGGAAKTPYAFASASIGPFDTSLTVYGSTSVAGWHAGDVITIDPVYVGGPVTTVSRTILSITGGPDYTVSWSEGGLGAARTLAADTPIVVGNLTRNVLVRSSGTDVNADSAYISNLVRNTTSFALTYGEFAYLGANDNGKLGITFDGALTKGSLSSSTVRNGYYGIFLNSASGNTLTGNNIYSNSQHGVWLYGGTNNTLLGNSVCSNSGTGIYLASAHYNTLAGNNSYSNTNSGIHLQGSTNNTLTGNASFINTAQGIYLGLAANNNTLAGNNAYSNSDGITFYDSSNNIGTGNISHANTGNGLVFSGSADNTLTGSNIYSNSNYGIYAGNSAGNTFDKGYIGYNAAGADMGNNNAEIFFIPGGSAETLVLKGSLVNPGAGISTAGMDVAGASLVSYAQDADTGTVRIWGNYQLAGSTLALDYAQRLYVSTNTAPKLMRGTGHSITNVATNDAATLSEIITVKDTGGDYWTVTGSSSGVLGTFYRPISGYYDFTHSKVNFKLTVGSTLNVDDALDFATMAASNDANTQKKLLFGPSALTNGRSKLEIASSGGIILRGNTDGAFPALVDRLDPSATYYTFVDSGAFTAEHSSFTNMDQDGIQLSGSAGVVMSSSTFDYLGVAAGTNTYITARGLTSGATFYNVAFERSRSCFGHICYNVSVDGNDTGLAPVFKKTLASLGQLWGEYNDYDPNAKVNWIDKTAYVDCGYRIFDGNEIWSIACQPPGAIASPLRIGRDGTAYGIWLAPVGDPAATRQRINTTIGIQTLRKY
ncbi:MAG: right-handed parallel beta-helix repeat-containing protein [Elusimicrobiota bacterium]